MKEKILAWIKAYIVDRWFGGAKRKAEAKLRRADDATYAAEMKFIIADQNKQQAEADLQKTIDEIQSREDF